MAPIAKWLATVVIRLSWVSADKWLVLYNSVKCRSKNYFLREFMAHSDCNIDISPNALAKAVWELPSVEGWEIDAKNKDRHATGMLLIKQMIEAGADQSRAVKFRTETYASTPIIIAAANNDAICLDFLLSAPFANPDFIDEEGASALAMAACYGFSSCVAMLAAICDPNVQDSQGRTALARAMCGGHSESVAILAPITDLSLLTDDGETARQFAQRCEKSQLYIPLLDSILERSMLAEAVKTANVGQAAHPGRRRSL